MGQDYPLRPKQRLTETMTPIHTPTAPTGHYSQAIVHGGLVFVAGQLPIDPARPEQVVGSIEEQTEQVLRNVGAILQAAGSGLDRVVQIWIGFKGLPPLYIRTSREPIGLS